jgi:ADP-heptose:LPS heptosyltransferase
MARAEHRVDANHANHANDANDANDATAPATASSATRDCDPRGLDDPFAPGLLQRLPATPRSLYVLKASRIGDFLCALPALQALRDALPGCRLTLITLPLLRPLAERVAAIDEVVDFPGYPGLAEQFFDARHANAFLAQMQARRFDLALQMQGSGVFTNPFVLMLGARHSAGFVRAGDGAGRLDAALALPEQGHEIDRMAALAQFLGALGAPARARRPRLRLTLADHDAAARLLGTARRPWLGVHTAARDPARCWGATRFASVVRALVRDTGATPVLLGEADDPRAAALARQLDGACVNLAGRTPLPVLAALIERLDLLLTTDSGPAHLAYASGTPSVVVFSHEAARYGPPPEGPHCIAGDDVAVEPQHVLALALQRLRRPGGAGAAHVVADIDTHADAGTDADAGTAIHAGAATRAHVHAAPTQAPR